MTVSVCVAASQAKSSGDAIGRGRPRSGRRRAGSGSCARSGRARLARGDHRDEAGDERSPGAARRDTRARLGSRRSSSDRRRRACGGAPISRPTTQRRAAMHGDGGEQDQLGLEALSFHISPSPRLNQPAPLEVHQMREHRSARRGDEPRVEPGIGIGDHRRGCRARSRRPAARSASRAACGGRSARGHIAAAWSPPGRARDNRPGRRAARSRSRLSI